MKKQHNDDHANETEAEQNHDAIYEEFEYIFRTLMVCLIVFFVSFIFC